MLYPNGDELTYAYNQVEAPTGLGSSVSGSVVSGASYTPWGASSSMLTGSGSGQVSTVRVYDQASLRVKSLTSTVSAVDVVDYSFEFDDQGNLTRLADTGLGVSGGPQYQCFGYDTLDRLTAAYTTTVAAGSGCGGVNVSGPDPYSNSWSYNDIGNMTSASGPGTATGNYTYGASIAGPHAVTTAGSNTYTYDTAGNQTVRTVAGNATQTLGYDVQNRLESITENSVAVGEYGYDADGVRTAVTDGGVTTFVIGEVYEITPGTPSVERVSYRFGGQTVGYNDGTGLRALAAGNLGSVEVEVTTAGVSTRQTYFPFGAVRSSGTNSLGTDRTFTDQIDDGTGLMHYRARQYDPTLGRFIQPDTIVPDATDSADFNRYTYVRNNPVNGTDPSGRCTVIVWWPDGTGYDCEFFMADAFLSIDSDGNVSGRSTITVNNDFRPGKAPTDPSCAAVEAYCSAQPGTSGLGFGGEVEAIEYIESLSPDEFWELTSDPDEIERQGLGFLDWSNNGCSNAPDGIGGISFLGACALHPIQSGASGFSALLSAAEREMSWLLRRWRSGLGQDARQLRTSAG